jgi:fatty acid kinase
MQEHTPHTTGVRSQRPRRISVFDGQDLKKAMLAGAASLEESREIINALNVFPVPDGDTGSNLYATMQAALRDVVNSEDTSAGVISAKMAHGALLGARGNSGVIFSNILRGLAHGLEKKQTFSALDLAMALDEAQRRAYRGAPKPVEGTILTVVRETAEAAMASAKRGDDLVMMMQESIIAARQSVARTPDLLPTLKQAGVVDAGGQGLCTILEGVWRYVRGEAGQLTTASLIASSSVPRLDSTPKKGRVKIEEEFGYEVVFLLRGEKLDVDDIRQTIMNMGGVSTIVAGDEKMLKVHTHTKWPGKILDYGVSIGSLLDINIENLQEQSLTYAAASEAEHTAESAQPLTEQIATVAVVAGPGFEKVFRSIGVTAIVPGGQTMNPSTEELLAAVNAVDAGQVILLPDNSNVVLSAQQVSGLSNKEIFVVPTESMPQGIAALLGFNFEADFESNCESMSEAAKHIQTAEITTAIRTVNISDVRVREGDLIGLVNGNLVIAGQDMDYVIRETLQRMNIDRYEIVTLYFGEGVSEQQAESTARSIKEKYSHLEIEVVDGGQPHYAYIISAE